jgi:hypothetical protein
MQEYLAEKFPGQDLSRAADSFMHPTSHWHTQSLPGCRSKSTGQINVSKMHTLKCAAYNLGLLLRKVWGSCKPRNAAAAGTVLLFAFWTLLLRAAIATGQATNMTWRWWLGISGLWVVSLVVNRSVRFIRACRKKCHSLTGC